MDNKEKIEQLEKENALLRKENRELKIRFNEVSENLDVCFWIRTTDEMIYVSRQYEKIFRKSTESLYDNPDSFIEIIHPDDQGRITKAVKNLKNGEKFDEEYRIINPEGKIEWIWAINIPVYYENGKLKRFVGIAKNITRQKQTEELLFQNREKLRDTLGSMDDLVFVIDKNGNFKEYYQPGDKKKLYVKPGEFINKHYSAVLPDDVAKKTRLAIDILRFTQKSQKIEYSMEIDGQTYWFSAKLSIRKDRNGDFNGITSVVRDISAEKKAENLLLENMEFLKTLLDTLPTPVFYKNIEGKYQGCNELFAKKILGLPKEQIIDKKLSEIKGIPAEIVRIYHDKDQELMKKKGSQVYEAKVKCADGKFRDFVFYKTVYYGTEKEVMGLIGVMLDVTEKNLSYSEIKEARKKAEESDKLKTDFLNNLSHEIRTPMNSIMVYSGLLKDNAEFPSVIRQYTGNIEDATKKLLQLFEDIIYLSKLTSGQLQVEKEHCYLNYFLKDLEVVYSSDKRSKEKKINIVFKKELEDEQAFLLTDCNLLREIFNKLLDNALKFTNEGNITFGVSREPDHFFRFYVSDTGCGIDPEKKQKIFEAFHQEDSSSVRKYSGAGMGLSICKGLVELLGGNIFIESEPAAGTTVYFTLPE